MDFVWVIHFDVMNGHFGATRVFANSESAFDYGIKYLEETYSGDFLKEMCSKFEEDYERNEDLFGITNVITIEKVEIED